MSFKDELKQLFETERQVGKEKDKYDKQPVQTPAPSQSAPTKSRPIVKEGNWFQRAGSALGLTQKFGNTKYVAKQAPDLAIRGDKAMNKLTTVQAGLQMQLDKRNAEQAQMDAIGVKKEGIKNLIGQLTPPPMGKEPTAAGKLNPSVYAPHAGSPNMDSKPKDPNATVTRNDKEGNNVTNVNVVRTRTGENQGAESKPKSPNVTVTKGLSTTPPPPPKDQTAGASTTPPPPPFAPKITHPSGENNLSVNKGVSPPKNFGDVRTNQDRTRNTNDAENSQNTGNNVSRARNNATADSLGSQKNASGSGNQDDQRPSPPSKGILNAIKTNYRDTKTMGDRPPSNTQGNTPSQPSPEQLQQQKEANIQKAAAGIQGTLAAVASSSNQAVTKGGRLIGGNDTKQANTARSTLAKAPPLPARLGNVTGTSDSLAQAPKKYSNELADALKTNGIKPEEFAKSEAADKTKQDAESSKRVEAQKVEDARKAEVLAKAKAEREKGPEAAPPKKKETTKATDKKSAKKAAKKAADKKGK